MTRPPAVVLTAPGTNREREAAHALELAGAAARIVSIDDAVVDPTVLDQARLLVVAGGFSFGDALGAGRLIALELQTRLAEQLQTFVAGGKPVLGVCNGFQALVRAGLLPGGTGQVALGHNENSRFECRWVTLTRTSDRCAWTSGVTEPILCPVAHGEGRFVAEESTLAALQAGDQIALVYAGPDGSPAKGTYPANPNGSVGDVAGICDETGLVMGLMPHPEDHVVPRQHPRSTRGERHGSGLPLFESGVRWVS
jgi:phosphoribosylformylglycinamidine synthase subunit PurQ / glutaminase